MVTFTINIPPMLAYIPYMDPMVWSFPFPVGLWATFFSLHHSGHEWSVDLGLKELKQPWWRLGVPHFKKLTMSIIWLINLVIVLFNNFHPLWFVYDSLKKRWILGVIYPLVNIHSLLLKPWPSRNSWFTQLHSMVIFQFVLSQITRGYNVGPPFDS